MCSTAYFVRGSQYPHKRAVSAVSSWMIANSAAEKALSLDVGAQMADACRSTSASASVSAAIFKHGSKSFAGSFTERFVAHPQ